jgi:hypothetical protein
MYAVQRIHQEAPFVYSKKQKLSIMQEAIKVKIVWLTTTKYKIQPCQIRSWRSQIHDGNYAGNAARRRTGPNLQHHR